MENTLLQSLLSTDNEVRRNAENLIENERNSNPASLINTFVNGMQNQQLDIASLSCVLLKKYFLDDRRSENITEADLEQMKQTILSTLDFNSQALTLLKRKGDIISKIYARQNKNEDLLKLLVEWAQSENNTGRQFSMYVFEVLSDCHLTPEQLNKHKDSFMTIFSKSLTDREINVRVAALKATTAFLTSIDDQDIVISYIQIIPTLLSTVVEALKTNEDQGKQALESMNELTNTHPEIWKNSTNQLVNVISQVMIQNNFENTTRASACEIVLTLAQQMPASLRKVEETRTMLFPALVTLLTEVDEDQETWQTTNEDKMVGQTDPFNTAVNALNTLSVALQEKTVMAITAPLIKTCLSNAQDWKQRQAGYMVLGLIAESCKESMTKNMEEAMKMACSGLMDGNTRVRYAGLSCTALLLTELSPKAQKKFHKDLVPAFIKMMNSEELLKMKTQAVSTMINFVRGFINADDDNEEDESTNANKIMEIYSKDLFLTLVSLLKQAMTNNYEPLQEEVMSLISCLASIIDKDFAKYYNDFMPMMLEILTVVGNQNMAQKNLRSRTIEAMGYMIEAVAEEKEAFVKNVTSITVTLIELLNNLTQDANNNDDPQILAIKEAIAKISSFLKEDFHQFMPQILPTLINDTQVDIDIKMDSANLPSASNTKSNTGYTFKMKGLEGEQRITMNTSALETKITAFKLINSIAENMEKSFAPYTEKILPIMTSNMNYQYSRVIRKYSLKTLMNILYAVGEPNNITLFKSIIPAMTLMLQVAVNRKDLKELKLLLKYVFLFLKTLNETNKVHKNYLEQNHFNILGPLLNKTLDLVRVAKVDTLEMIKTKRSGFEIDEEDLDNIKMELAKVCDASSYVMEISGQLVLNYGEQVGAFVRDNLLNYFAMNIENYADLSESELLDATCFFCDYVEYAFHSDAMMMYELCIKFVEIFNAEVSMDVKQTLSYGMGVYAMFTPTMLFGTMVPKVFNALNSMVSDKDAFTDDNIVATESALGALGKMIYFQRENKLINDAVVNTFLSKLPLLNEVEEAQKSHQIFFEQILKNNQNVFNANTKQNVMQAVLRIQSASNDENANIEVLSDEGKQLLEKVLKL